MKAGFAVKNITPRVGVELCGFGPFLNRHSIGVRDFLEARAAAFEVAGKRVVLISCDLIGVPREIADLAKSVITAQRPDLTPADIMIACSHSTLLGADVYWLGSVRPGLCEDSAL